MNDLLCYLVFYEGPQQRQEEGKKQHFGLLLCYLGSPGGKLARAGQVAAGAGSDE